MDYNLIEPRDTAILVIDIQNGYCSPQGKMAKLGHKIPGVDKLVSNIESFVSVARQNDLTVIFTRMIEDPKYMSQNVKTKVSEWSSSVIISPNTKDFDYFKIEPQKPDFEIVKKSYDAFTNEKLDNILKKRRIKNIIFTGVHSQVCVDSTVRAAFSKGYNIVIPIDLISTDKRRKNQEKATIEIWKQIFAHITTSKQIMSKWRKI